MDSFLTKFGHESSYFFVKNQEKGASYWHFEPIIQFSYDRIDVFVTTYGLESRGSWKINKKNCIRTVCFLKNGSFDTKYGHESGDFSVKKRKKGILLTLMAHNLVSFWQNRRFFWGNMTMTGGVSSWKFCKKIQESTMLLRDWTFYDKIWALEQIIFREWTFQNRALEQ